MQIVEKAHEQLEIKLNKLGNNYRKKLSDFQKDELLNIALFDYEQFFVHGRNPKILHTFAEKDQQNIDMLSTLIRSSPVEGPINTTFNQFDITQSIYGYLFKDLDEPYLSFITAQIKVKDCTERFKVTPVYQHGELYTILEDPFRKPSKLWKRAVGLIRNEGLFVYTNAAFISEQAYITYYKKADRFSLGTYKKIATASDPNPGLQARQDCDLPDTYLDLVVNLAVENYHLIYGNREQRTIKEKIDITT